jgi:hypothetical protein
MQYDIDGALKEMTFKEVIVKDSSNYSLTMFLPEEVPLMLLNKSMQVLFDLSPVGPHFCGAVPKDHYVIADFLYKISRAIPRYHEKQFYEFLTRKFQRRSDFEIKIDGSAILETDRIIVFNKKLKEILKSRKEEGEFKDCKRIETRAPHDKSTVYLFN